ncbi:hypothetical protein Tco_0610659, partial [Tanacetum coccineum]
ESSLTGLELVQETTDKVVLVKEKPKAARDRQKGYVDCRCKPLEFKVEIRLRLLEELSSVHDTFHVSNLKKCLADANLHVPLDEIKVNKTLRFVEEPVEIMDREIKKLKRRKIALVKVRWNSKRGPEFTGENEDHMRIKYPQLFVDQVVEPARGLLASIHDLFSRRYCGLVRRVICGYPWPGLRETTGIRERLRSSAWCLSIQQDEVIDRGMFVPILVGKNDLILISHLFYADDAMFIGKWSSSNVDVLMMMLHWFFLVSDLKVNIQKSSLYGLGLHSSKIQSMANSFGCLADSLPFTYLGVKVAAYIAHINSWNEVIEKVTSKLSKWKAKSLSVGGRLTLLKLVLRSLPTYYMSLFKAQMEFYLILNGCVILSSWERRWMSVK